MKKQVAYLQKLFYDLWNDFGSVYLLVNYSDRTRIGKRGFTEEETKRGLVLVFNNKTNTELNWDEAGNLSCVLAFGSRREDVFIHHEDLKGVFSAEANVQFIRNDMDGAAAAEEQAAHREGEQAEPQGEGKQQVISLTSYRKRKGAKSSVPEN